MQHKAEDASGRWLLMDTRMSGTEPWWCAEEHDCAIGRHPSCVEMTEEALSGDYRTTAEEYSVNPEDLERHLREGHFRPSPQTQRANRVIQNTQLDLYNELVRPDATHVDILNGLTRLLVASAIEKFQDASPVEASRLNREIRENIVAVARLRKEIGESNVTQINVHQQTLQVLMQKLKTTLPQSDLVAFLNEIEEDEEKLMPEMELPTIMDLPSLGPSDDYLKRKRLSK